MIPNTLRNFSQIIGPYWALVQRLGSAFKSHWMIVALENRALLEKGHATRSALTMIMFLIWVHWTLCVFKLQTVLSKLFERVQAAEPTLLILMKMMAVLWDDPFTLLWRRTLIYSLLVFLMSGARTFGDETFNGEVILSNYQCAAFLYHKLTHLIVLF